MKLRIPDDVYTFIVALEPAPQAKTLRYIDLLETAGYALGAPYTKKIENDLFELRIKGKQEIRLFYTFHNNSIVLLSGFIKKSQKLPTKELQKAKKRLAQLDTI